jgi:acetyl esterase
VHYRRAPEAPAPAAADDCEAVTSALLERGQPVAVAGDSAGGNLAAAVANRCGAKGARLAAQALIYPVTDCAAETASYETFADGFLLSRATMRYFRDCYAPTETLRLSPDVSPLRAPSLAGAAPAYVLLAGCDVLRDEGRAYAARLQQAGVETVLDEVPGVLHGFVSMQGLGVTREATRRLVAWLDARLAAA